MAIRVGRREFVATLGGAMAAVPFAALAQQAGKLPTIGFFSAGSAAAVSSWVAALMQRLGELGFWTSPSQ
jgi:putative tryptophan/tyrosine transport system substrate-binding protein